MTETQAGTVYWITGLAGAGKTTVAAPFAARLRKSGACCVFLDGDELREVLGSASGFSMEERKGLAMQYAKMCRMLSRQGLDVVCATISMFSQVRQWNRENIPSYKEIYLRVPMEVLVERDKKGLYSRALEGKISDVMGVDCQADEPACPDLIVDNDGSKTVEQAVGEIWGCFLGT